MAGEPPRWYRPSVVIAAIAAGWLASAGVSLAAEAAAPLMATSARLGEHPDKTRFVVGLSATTTYRVFTLANPNRVVIELPEVDWRLPAGTGLTGQGLVKAFRFGRFRAGTSRIVLDLWKPARINSDFVLPPAADRPARLVIDLAATSQDVFEKAAGWPDDPIAALIEEEPPVGAGLLANDPGRKPVIVIDAGHGGVDSGARGTGGQVEKDVALAAAQSLRDALRKTDRYEIVMTRDSDVFLDLRERVAIARRARADLFISLHADSIDKPRVRGASVYTLSETASDREAEALARSENASDIIAGADLTDETGLVREILIGLAMRETKNFSTMYARALTPELSQATPIVTRPHRYAGFVVLKAPDVPSVLVELGFLSNREDEADLGSAEWRARVAAAMVRATDLYFEKVRAAQTITGPVEAHAAIEAETEAEKGH